MAIMAKINGGSNIMAYGARNRRNIHGSIAAKAAASEIMKMAAALLAR
jgi:hypothetical protein